MLYLGEINSSQAQAWRKAIEIFDEEAGQARTLALFPDVLAGLRAVLAGHDQRDERSGILEHHGVGLAAGTLAHAEAPSFG